MKRLERGAATFTVLEIMHDGTSGDIKKRIEKAQAHAAKDPRRDGAALASGFASGTAVMESNITAENSVIDDTLKLHYRTIQRKIVASMLRAMIEQMEAEARADNDGRLTRKERKEIKAEAKDMLEKDAPYTLKEVELIFCDGVILVGSTSKHDVGIVQEALSHSLDILAYQDRPNQAADMAARQEFFSWLMNGEEKKLKTGEKVETSFAGAVEFYSNSAVEADDENFDACTKTTLDGPCVNESAEIKTVLQNKKTISRAKIHLGVGLTTAWTFKFDADKWTFGGVKITGAHHEGLTQRAECLARLNSIMKELFNTWKKQRDENEGVVDMFDEAEKKKPQGTLGEAIDSAVETTKKKLDGMIDKAANMTAKQAQRFFEKEATKIAKKHAGKTARVSVSVEGSTADPSWEQVEAEARQIGAKK